MNIFDANVGVGHWPFRKLAVETPEQVRSELQRAGIERALVYSLNAVFYKDVRSGNRELARLVGEPWARVAAVVNPARPGAWDDIEEALEKFNARAVRLFPSCHGYRLDDPFVAQFLSRLRESRPHLPVMITVRLEDERLRHPIACANPPELDAVCDLARSFPDLPIILMGINSNEAKRVLDVVGEKARVYFEISRMTDGEFLPTVLEMLPAERLIFGSNLPLFVPECAVLKVANAAAPEEAKQKISHGNLAELVGENQI